MNQNINPRMSGAMTAPTIKAQSFFRRLHIDLPLLFGLLALTAIGLIILYSAEGGDVQFILQQGVRFAVAYGLMFIAAQISPHTFYRWAPWIFLVGLILLIGVLAIGDIGKGARRWLDIGFIRFQPSEIMKVAIPMFVAWYLHDKVLPPKLSVILITGFIIAVPVLLTAKQPDLGTALMLAFTGAAVLFLSGFSWRLMIIMAAVAASALPLLWSHMHDYQRQRVLTFLDPERDPLGAGYHIIQSKIAIGSGGIFGKGWLNGTQSHLDFLPEHATDFIFAVAGEEFGLVGAIIIIAVYLYVVLRGLHIAMRAQDTFTRLLAGGISLTFFFSVFINIGMVIGILPVVGVPLPLISYGGTSMLTLMISFGILMSIQTHRKLLAK